MLGDKRDITLRKIRDAYHKKFVRQRAEIEMLQDKLAEYMQKCRELESEKFWKEENNGD